MVHGFEMLIDPLAWPDESSLAGGWPWDLGGCLSHFFLELHLRAHEVILPYQDLVIDQITLRPGSGVVRSQLRSVSRMRR